MVLDGSIHYIWTSGYSLETCVGQNIKLNANGKDGDDDDDVDDDDYDHEVGVEEEKKDDNDAANEIEKPKRQKKWQWLHSISTNKSDQNMGDFKTMREQLRVCITGNNRQNSKFHHHLQNR